MNYFFDVGANIGQTFYWYLANERQYDGWNVFCFEPSPRNLLPLTNVVRQYDSRYNIVVCPFGLSGETGVSEFYLKTDPAGDSYVKEWVTNESGNMLILSPTISASWFIENYTKEEDKIVLKLDCEGSEYGILENLIDYPELFSRISNIMVEWHGEEERKAAIIKRYQEANITLNQWMF